MPDRAMLESSMLLHRDSANYLLALIRNGPLDNIVVSRRLVDRLAAEDATVFWGLGQYLGLSAAEFDWHTSKKLALEFLSADKTNRMDVKKDDPIYITLINRTRDEFIAHILYEEWLFLTSQSWLFSKVRQAIDEMVEVGGTVIHKSCKQFDHLVRKTLKKKSDEPLTPNDKARAAAKWVAVGGPSIWSAIEPISGAMASTVSGIILLCDP